MYLSQALLTPQTFIAVQILINIDFFVQVPIAHRKDCHFTIHNQSKGAKNYSLVQRKDFLTPHSVCSLFEPTTMSIYLNT